MQNPAVKSPQSGALSPTLSIVICAMFTVLVYGFTMIHINPFGLPGGLVHLGNVPAFVAAILFGKKIGAISTAAGMTLMNLLSPYVIWAPFTFVIGLAMGFTVASVAHERRLRFPLYVLAMVLAAIIRVVGYFFAEVILFGNWFAPMAAIPANLIQVFVGAVIVLIIIEPLRIAADRTFLRSRTGGQGDV